jgi:hypothetical protein
MIEQRWFMQNANAMELVKRAAMFEKNLCNTLTIPSLN